MKVISQNLGFRNKDFLKAARNGDKATMSVMAEVLKKAGADIINIGLSLDGDGDEKFMEAAVVAVQRAGLPLSIDSRNPKAQQIAAKVAEVPLIVNYLCAEDSRAKEMDEILTVAASGKSDLVLYALRKGTPADADERLQIIESLIEKANAAGIPSERLIVDPVILHLGGGIGQEHAVAVQETLYGIRELVEPPIRTTCWLSNISAGAPKELRTAINNTYLAVLAGLWLWSAYVDVMDKHTMRTVRLIPIRTSWA
jgi:cobalamin-dependent methionine synthase I